MPVINRALHKAYQRRAESQVASESNRPSPEKDPAKQAPATVSGWASKLREPLRPLTSAALATGPAIPAAITLPVHEAQPQSNDTQKSDTHACESTLPLNDTKPAFDSSANAGKDAPSNDLPAPLAAWSWPPIVQRLLTCPAAPELRDLAVQLRELAAGSDLRCVAFSGPGRNVGRTSLVLTLASVLIADKKTRVAIVDADFEHPAAGQLISLPSTTGLEEAIRVPGATDAVTTLIDERLSIVPLARPVAAETLDRRRIGTLQTFLRSLRREHDLVLIDAGPWDTAQLPHVLECRAVDAVVCVCRSASPCDPGADETNFRQPGIEWLGVIETFAEIQSQRATSAA